MFVSGVYIIRDKILPSQREEGPKSPMNVHSLELVPTTISATGILSTLPSSVSGVVTSVGKLQGLNDTLRWYARKEVALANC